MAARKAGDSAVGQDMDPKDRRQWQRVLVDLEGPVSGDPTNFDVSLRLRISAIDLAVIPA